ncbi:MAG TPA: methylated-DNA--[protein]-cysteine S-methyltransferase [Candidatus Methylacidiphilales bacterium]
MTSYSTLKHPLIGELLLIANPTELIGIYFADWKHTPKIQSDWKRNPTHPVLEKASKQIRDYLDGRRRSFSIPLRYTGTGFQRQIWKQIASIPFGETISYSELAKRAGKSKAVRAAGSATGKNPLCVVIPCHRVIAKNGTLGGFAGGLPRKRRLLAVEKNP